MLNSLELYRDTGERAGRAMRRGDTALYQQFARHYVAMRNAERGPDRRAAEDAYKAGYKSIMLPYVAGANFPRG